MVSGFLAGAAGGAVVNVIITAVDQFSKTFNKVGEQSALLSKKMAATGVALAGAGIAGTVALGNLAKEAGKGVGVATAFNNMFGKRAPKALKALKKATRGTVSDVKLMTQANQALLLGIDPEALPEMFEGAFAAASATGRPVADAINDITTGIGRQSRLILDNLGIIVNAEKANEAWALSLGKSASELTELEKKQAFTNATMEALRTNMENIGEITDNAATATQKASAEWENAKQILGEALAPALIVILEKFTDLIEKFNDLDPQTQKLIGILAAITAGVVALTGVVITLTVAVSALTAASAPWLLILLGIVAAIGLAFIAGLGLGRLIEENIIPAVKRATEFFGGLIDKILAAIRAIRTFLSLGGGGGGDDDEIPAFKSGGFVSKTGLALVHKGETVIPAGKGFGGGAGGIVFNIENINGLDPEEVARALQEQLFNKVSF